MNHPAANLITDVAGVRVGHAHDARLASGVTAIVFDAPVIAAVDLRGGAPGTRETDLLEPHRTVQGVDAIVFTGGSAFGLDSAAGVQAWLAEQGRGFPVRDARVPIVCAAVLFDLLNGGDKAWGRYPPYREFGYAAAAAAARDFALGTAGGGFGAQTLGFKGGLGSASAQTSAGHTVGAIAAVNACGSAVIAGGPWFWAAPFEQNQEFGGHGLPAVLPRSATAWRTKGLAGENTTLGLVATDARLTKAQAKQLAIMAQDGIARALYPAHTPLDGDIVFAAATGRRALDQPFTELGELGGAAANALARAIARGVYEARALPFAGALPSWRDRFGTG